MYKPPCTEHALGSLIGMEIGPGGPPRSFCTATAGCVRKAIRIQLQQGGWTQECVGSWEGARGKTDLYTPRAAWLDRAPRAPADGPRSTAVKLHTKKGKKAQKDHHL